MPMITYYQEALKKYAVFTGRSRRSEYWYFVLINFIISLILPLFGQVGSLLSYIYILAIIIPGLAVSIRRLHDTNRTGWWIFLALIPFVGAIVLLVFFATDSDPATNEYGPNPEGVGAHIIGS
jgi:uncharacterized membrane protein YhaH (DUF805 family)